MARVFEHQIRMACGFLALALALGGCSVSLDGNRFEDRPFSSDWRFMRGDAQGAEQPGFDDSSWRVLDVPHDWSIEDLPPADKTVPECQAVTGKWRFSKGDDLAWKDPAFQDGDWQEVTLPGYWEKHSSYTGDNVYGWYRRTLAIPDDCKGTDFDLLLGYIDDVDEVWLNGERLGQTGSFPPDYQSAYDKVRRYRVSASAVRGDGSDLLAVRVYDAAGEGGIYREGVKTVRVGPFDSAQSAGGPATGHVVGGTGWYRKRFTLGDCQLVTICFDGVYMNTDVWLNGHHLGHHPYGYTAFEFDVTPYLKPAGQENVLAVRVRNEGRNSRWYSGSGIYRPVRLTFNEPVHVPTWGVFVTTPEVSKDRAVVKISTEVRNTRGTDTDVTVRTLLMDRDGRFVTADDCQLHVPAGQVSTAEQTATVKSPRLWSPDSPHLYQAHVTIAEAGKTSDAVTAPFGIRKIEVDAKNGFRLNGQTLKLKGGCMHHDNGGLGAAAIDRAEERRVELMKANGFNAIRTSHNPPSIAFLDACDRLGILVIDEAFDCWVEQKNEQDYHLYFDEWAEHDIASMVRRDRNHPSVIMWSIGNEIPEKFRRPDIAKRLRQAVLAHDSTRPVTAAICSDWGGTVNRDWDGLSDPAFIHLDAAGYNYLPDKYESDHARRPERVMMGSESYPKDVFAYWSLVEKHPYIIGDFVWTSMDYLGESGIGHSVLSTDNSSGLRSWPWFNAWCGDIDLCGFKKPQSYYRDVVWGRSLLEMAVHAPLPQGVSERVSAWGWPNEHQSWNWSGHEGTPLQVSVYSQCDSVRLELNGTVIGEKPVSRRTRLTATFSVPYAAGELCAIGLVDGKPAARKTLKTTGVPAAIRLTADRDVIRAERGDLCYVTVEVVDAEGLRVPDAEVNVHFQVSGAGELAAQMSGSPNDAASFRAPLRKTFEGRCMAILRPAGLPGKIVLSAEAQGLTPSTVKITTR